jgi:hypothetical protein
MKRRLWIVAVLLVLAVFAAFVWPTRYHYFELKRGEGVSFVMRADRFSDKTWILTPGGWKSNTPPPPPPRTVFDDLPPPQPVSPNSTPGFIPDNR